MGRIKVSRPGVHRGADPGTTSFVPRPDWYFYFLFYLPRIFKNGRRQVFLGTVGVPTIALILLIGRPVLDVAPRARLSRRPVAVVGADARRPPRWASSRGKARLRQSTGLE